MERERVGAERPHQPTSRNMPLNSVTAFPECMLQPEEAWPEDPAFPKHPAFPESARPPNWLVPLGLLPESARPPNWKEDMWGNLRPFGNIVPGSFWQGADSEDPNAMWESMEPWSQDPEGEAPYQSNQGTVRGGILASGSHSLPWKIDKAMSSGRLNI